MPIRWRPLLVLTAAVLAGHAWLLRPAPDAVQPTARTTPRSLITRSLPAQLEQIDVAAVAAPPAPAPDVSSPTALPAAAPLRTRAPRADTQRAVRPTSGAVVVAADASSAASKPSAPASNTAPSLAFAVPSSRVWHYRVTAHARGFELNGKGELRWHHDGQAYEAQLELSGPLLPSRKQQSSGRITAEGLAPLRFSDKVRSEEAAHFERDQGKVSFSSNRPDAALMAGAQDRLSIMLQLGAMIGGQPKNFGPGTTISIQTASTREAEVWQFTVEGKELLQLPGGQLSAIKLIRNPRKEFDQKVELWLAPNMDYAPVRLRLTQPNGDWVDQQWSSTDKG